MHDTLLHWEALLVISTGDSEDVALELIADGVAWDLLAHSAVHEDAQLAVIVDFNQLLRAVGGKGDVQLHLDGRGRDEVAERGGCCRGSAVSVEVCSQIENLNFLSGRKRDARNKVDPRT